MRSERELFDLILGVLTCMWKVLCMQKSIYKPISFAKFCWIMWQKDFGGKKLSGISAACESPAKRRQRDLLIFREGQIMTVMEETHVFGYF